MANNLKDHLKEVADAIRAKKGTTDLINPQDFATEIEGISGGGSGEGSGSNWRFFDVSNVEGAGEFVMLPNFTQYSKIEMYNKKYIEQSATFKSGGITSAMKLSAIAVDFAQKITYVEEGSTIPSLMTVSDVWQKLEATPELILSMGGFEITKEQFYDLNA